MSLETVGRGGTIRLDGVFTDGAGQLVDPDTPLLDILNPSDTEVETDLTPVRQSVGNYYYDYVVGGAAPLGIWSAHWTGSVNGGPVAGDDYFQVVAAGEVGFDSTFICTPTEVAEYLDLDATQASTLLAASATVTSIIAGVQGTLEAFLQRPITERLFTETFYPTETSRTLLLRNAPVVEIVSVDVDDEPVDLDTLVIVPGGITFTPDTSDAFYDDGNTVIAYRAGLSSPDACRHLVCEAASRVVKQRMDDNRGVEWLVVEGYNWRPVSAHALFTREELQLVSSLKRRRLAYS